MSLILALSFAELMQPGIPGSDRVAAEPRSEAHFRAASARPTAIAS
jgi:hypothetical protein